MTGDRAVFDQAMRQGHSAAWDQEWDRAVAAYGAALQEIPEEPNALTSLAFALFQSDRLDEALKCYQRAATLTPGDPIAPEKCGEIFERLGRLNEAAQTYLAVAEVHLKRRDVHKAMDNWARVVRLTPDNLAAHSRLALASERTGQTGQAIREYIEVARIFQRARDIEKALAAAGRAQQLDPQSPDARDALDRLHRGQPLPLPERVQPAASSAAQVEPESAAGGASQRTSPLTAALDVALGRLAEMMFEEDADLSKSVGSMGPLARSAGRLRGDPVKRSQANKHLSQAISSQTAGDLPAAVTQYERALKAGLDSPVVGFVLGALKLELNHRAEAITWLQQAPNQAEVGVGALYGLGQAEHLEGHDHEAFQHLLEALRRLDRQLVDPARRDSLDEAYESLAEDVRQTSAEELAPVVGSLLQFLTGEGWSERVRQARRELDSTAADGSVSPLAELLTIPGASQIVDSLRQIETYMARQLWSTAMEEAYFAVSHAPTHLPVHVRMAEILTAENKVQAAIDKYAVVAEAYRIRGDLPRAARIVQQVLHLSPLDVTLRSSLIEMLVEQHKILDALQQFADLADTYYQLADLDQARATYADALLLAEQQNVGADWRVKLLHKMGDIDLQRLNWREAQNVYEQIKNVAPDDHSARATLIDLLFRLGNARQALAEVDSYVRHLVAAGNTPLAVSLLEETIESQPDEIGLVARLARLYQETGRRAEAISQYDHLGELQLEAGLTTQAAETIRTILSLQPDDPAAYQQLLREIER